MSWTEYDLKTDLQKKPHRTLKLKLELEVEYRLNGEGEDVMRQMLHRAVERAVDDGMLTGGTDAEVLQYGFDVDDVVEKKKGAQARKPKRPLKKR